MAHEPENPFFRTPAEGRREAFLGGLAAAAKRGQDGPAGSKLPAAEHRANGGPPAGSEDTFLADFTAAAVVYLRRDCGLSARQIRKVALRLLCVTEPATPPVVPPPDRQP